MTAQEAKEVFSTLRNSNLGTHAQIMLVLWCLVFG